MPYIGGLYSGLECDYYDVNDFEDVEELDTLLFDIAEQGAYNNVVSLVMFPSAFKNTGPYVGVQASSIDKPTMVENYVPRNNKLLTYPYVFLTVDTLNSVKNYRYEWFKTTDDKADFVLTCGTSPSPEIIVSPMGYNMGETAGAIATFNPTESVTCSGFPQCAFTIDSYSAWLAQKALPQAISATGSGAGAILASNPAGQIAGAVGLASAVTSMLIDSTMSAKVRGSQGNSTEVASRTKGVYFKKMGITSEYAKVIDSYFDRFGYACEKIKIPNRNARPHWTYTKTRDVGIKGTVPSDAMRKLKEIYNKGITFWAHGSEVGDYSLDNRTVHGGGE